MLIGVKKIKSYIVCLFGLMLASTSIAYVPGKEFKAETPIYCPPAVVCPSGSGDSCKPKDGDPQYWVSMGGNMYNATEIPLTFVDAPYHFDLPLVVQCIYNVSNYQRVILSSKPESNLEALNQNGSLWVVSDGRANCYGKLSTQCPLRRQSSVVIHNIDIPGGLVK